MNSPEELKKLIKYTQPALWYFYYYIYMYVYIYGDAHLYSQETKGLNNTMVQTDFLIKYTLIKGDFLQNEAFPEKIKY